MKFLGASIVSWIKKIDIANTFNKEIALLTSRFMCLKWYLALPDAIK